MLAEGAGIFNSRIGSFLGSELWRAGWLAVIECNDSPELNWGVELKLEAEWCRGGVVVQYRYVAW